MDALVVFIGALAVAYIVIIICYYLGMPLWLTLFIHAGVIFYGCYHLALMITPDFSRPEGVWVLTVAISSGFVVFGHIVLKETKRR